MDPLPPKKKKEKNEQNGFIVYIEYKKPIQSINEVVQVKLFPSNKSLFWQKSLFFSIAYLESHDNPIRPIGLAVVLCRGDYRTPPAPRPTPEQQKMSQFMQVRKPCTFIH